MKRIISVFLILLLLLPAGCKQQNTEPAAPGGGNTLSSEDQTHQTKDYYICQYHIRLKEAFANRDYTLADFGVPDAKELQSFNNPGVYYIHAVYDDRDKVSDVAQALLNREDLANLELLYETYTIENVETIPNLPTLKRNPIPFENHQVCDGMFEAFMKYDGLAINNILSISDFPDIPIEGLRVFCKGNEASAGFYLKESGIDSLNGYIKQFQTYPCVQLVRLSKYEPETFN